MSWDWETGWTGAARRSSPKYLRACGNAQNTILEDLIVNVQIFWTFYNPFTAVWVQDCPFLTLTLKWMLKEKEKKVHQFKLVCDFVSAGAVSSALLPDWLTQTPASRKWHCRSPPSVHVDRFSVILDTLAHTRPDVHTDKHPFLSSSSLSRRIAPCLTVHPLAGCVRLMSCSGIHFKETVWGPLPHPFRNQRSRPQLGGTVYPTLLRG